MFLQRIQFAHIHWQKRTKVKHIVDRDEAKWECHLNRLSTLKDPQPLELHYNQQRLTEFAFLRRTFCRLTPYQLVTTY